MMEGDGFSRRSILKLASSAGAIGSVGLVAGTQADDGVRLVEVARSYELPAGPNYHRFGLDNLPTYNVDAERGELTATDEAPKAFTDFRENETAINGDRAGTQEPTTLGGEPVDSLVTALASHSRPLEAVRLAESYVPEGANVHIGNEKTKLTVGDEEVTVLAGDSVTLDLEPREVTVATIQVSEERVQVENVPKHRRGLKTSYDSVAVPGTPVIKVRDYGTLSVR